MLLVVSHVASLTAVHAQPVELTLNVPEERPLAFVCGPTGFVEAASALLLQAGQRAEAIRTERFGPTGS